MAAARTSRHLRFESIEHRLCLAVTAGLAANGDLLVEGDSAGAIEIVALDADSFQVSENAVVVGTVDGVRRGIRIALGAANDVVTLDLAGQSLNKDLHVSLGE